MPVELTEAQQRLLNSLPINVKIEGSHLDNQVFVDDKPLPIKTSLKVMKHSPTGFNWGYGGSGPAQFALALLLHYAPRDLAVEFYQTFKFGWVAGLPRADFVKTINLREVMQKIFEKEAGVTPPPDESIVL